MSRWKPSRGGGGADLLHPEDREPFVDLWRSLWRAGSRVEPEHRVRGADGEYHWIWDRAIPLRDAQGKIVSWYSVSTDIEDMKRAGERVRQAERRSFDSQSTPSP